MLEYIIRDIERANSDIKNMQYEIKRVPKIKEIELNGKQLNTKLGHNVINTILTSAS